MSSAEITPVNHGVLSATGATAVDTAKGGVSGLVKGGLWGTLIGAALLGGPVGLIAGAAGAFSATGFLGGIAAAGGVVATLIAGAIGGSIGGSWGMVGGTIKGAVDGASNGIDRVKNESAMAQTIDLQREQAAAQAETARAMQMNMIQNAQHQQHHQAAMQQHMAAAPSTAVSGAHWDGTVAGPQYAMQR